MCVWLWGLCFFAFVTPSTLLEVVTLPPDLDVDACYRDDPKVAECIKNALEILLPIFKEGSEEYDLVPIDPMELKNVEFSYKSYLLGGRIVLSNVTSSGLNDLKVKKIRVNVDDPKKFLLDADVFVPKLNIKTDYKLSGNIIQAPIKIKGHLDMDFVDCNLVYHIVADVKPDEEGVEFLDLTSFRWRLRGEGIRRLYLLNDDVVHERPALNRLVVRLVRSSWKVLMKSMVPTLLPETDKHLKAMFSSFFNKVPYDALLPKRDDPEEEELESTTLAESMKL